MVWPRTGHCRARAGQAEQARLTTALIAALELALHSARLLPGDPERRGRRGGAREPAGAAPAPIDAPSELRRATGRVAEIDRALAQARVAFARLGAALAHAHADELAGTLALVPAADGPPAGLSAREAEVLGLLARGGSTHDIARALFLSPRTVQRHIANIYAKIGAHNRAEATAFALTHRLA